MNNRESTIPTVSVCLITYNHEKYIAQAIESVLAQRTTFPFEVCVGEDGSSDGTAAICESYQKRYPDRLRVSFRSRNEVIYVCGAATGRHNFVATVMECRGKYLALLEGDDYWTDHHKLQQQIEFLEGNRDCVLCGHYCQVLNESSGSVVLPRRTPMQSYTLRDFFLFDNRIRTSSVVFRRSALPLPPPPFLRMVAANANFLKAIVCRSGGYAVILPRVMSCYRLHAGGRWSSLTSKRANRLIARDRSIMQREFGKSVPAEIKCLRAIRMLLVARSTRSRGSCRHLLPLLLGALRTSPGTIVSRKWGMRWTWECIAAARQYTKCLLRRRPAAVERR